MKILFFGGKERGVACLRAVYQAGHEIIGVVWDKKSLAVVPDGLLDEFPEVMVDGISVLSLKPEVTVLAGYPKLISQSIIDLASVITINLHAGPVPKYRGPHPMNWVLIRGEEETAFSILEVNRGVDTGPIVAQERIIIGSNDTYKDLLEMSLSLYPDMLLYVLDQISCGGLGKIKQDPKDGFWCSRRYPQDGEINWGEMTAQEVHNLVRALVPPMPGARAFCSRLDRGEYPEQIIIEETRTIERTYLGIPGRVAAHWGRGVVVVCKDRGLLVTKARKFDHIDGTGQFEATNSLSATEVLPTTGRNMVYGYQLLGDRARICAERERVY